jgi:hypothetical protein
MEFAVYENSGSESEISSELNLPVLSERFVEIEFEFPSDIFVWSSAQFAVSNWEFDIFLRTVSVLLWCFLNWVSQIICKIFTFTLRFFVNKFGFHVNWNIFIRSWLWFLCFSENFSNSIFIQRLEISRNSSFESHIHLTITAIFTTINYNSVFSLIEFFINLQNSRWIPVSSPPEVISIGK